MPCLDTFKSTQILQRRAAAALAITGVFGSLAAAPAYAGPCAEEATRFEQAMRQAGRHPTQGPTARQSVDAQLSHQPTPGSVARAQEMAESHLQELLTRAKALDSTGDSAGCRQALAEARLMFQ